MMGTQKDRSDRTNRPGLSWAIGLYLAFCSVVVLANIIAGAAEKTGREILEMIGGLVLLFIVGMVGLGLVLPLYLRRRSVVEIALLPREKRPAVVVLAMLAVFLFGRNGYLVGFVQSPPSLSQSVAVFFGPVLVHLASMMVCYGVLLPALRRQWGAVTAVVLTTIAWCVYHALQFCYFPEGKSPTLQFELFSFGLGYALFYLWSGSFVYTYALQHLIAVSAFIHNRDLGFGEVDEPFIMSVVVTALVLVYVFWVEHRRCEHAGEQEDTR